VISKFARFVARLEKVARSQCILVWRIKDYFLWDFTYALGRIESSAMAFWHVGTLPVHL
jgi:hypothetical protein